MNIKFLSIIAGMFLVLGTFVAVSNVYAQEAGEQFVVQNTTASMPDPLPGHESHQIAILAPPQEGSIYSGRVTWTASQPVEAVVLHPYNNASIANATDAGTQVTAVLPNSTSEVAISLMKQESGTPVNAGSLDFAGTAFALHNINGDPFTATYTIVADVVEAPETAEAEDDTETAEAEDDTETAEAEDDTEE